jgi:hypothetical protein
MSYVSSLKASEREQLILAHLPQVRLIATRTHHRCPTQVELDDLVSAGTGRRSVLLVAAALSRRWQNSEFRPLAALFHRVC